MDAITIIARVYADRRLCLVLTFGNIRVTVCNECARSGNFGISPTGVWSANLVDVSTLLPNRYRRCADCDEALDRWT